MKSSITRTKTFATANFFKRNSVINPEVPFRGSKIQQEPEKHHSDDDLKKTDKVNNLINNAHNENEIENDTERKKAHTEMIDSIDKVLTLLDGSKSNSNEQESSVNGRKLMKKTDYQKLKDDCKSLEEELDNLVNKNNYYGKLLTDLQKEKDKLNETYKKKEEAKIKSITEMYKLEGVVRELIIKNSKLQNEITKEKNEKINVFRALNELKKKYKDKTPKDILLFCEKIHDDTYSTIINIDDNEIKFKILKDSINKLKKEVDEKRKIKKDLEKIIAEKKSKESNK